MFTTLCFLHLCYIPVPKWIKFIFASKILPPLPKHQIPNRLISHQSEDGAKRQKLSDSGAALAANVPQLGGIRRSTRHRKLRGEKALIVSANQTLKELKIQVGAGAQRPRTGAGRTHLFLCLTVQIMHAFSVAPFDQNLSIDGKGLTDDSATLGSLGVVPESIICLKVAAAKLEAARGWREQGPKLPPLFVLSRRRTSRCRTTPPWTTCIKVSVVTGASACSSGDADALFSVYSRNA